MDKQILKAESRKIVGRKVKALREKGILPANLFGKKVKSQSLQIGLDDFKKAFAKVGETGLLTLVVGKEEKPVLVANVQKNPVTDLPLHVDFHQVDLKEKVEAEVAIEVIGESPAEKQGIGTLVQYLNEIKVEALPTDLPEKFEIDASQLAEVGKQVVVGDLKYDAKKVEMKIPLETILVKVEPPQKVEEAPAPAPAEGEVPVEGEAPVEEGKPEEGEKKEGPEGKEAPAEVKKEETPKS